MAPTGVTQDWAHLGKVIRRTRLAAGIKRQEDLAGMIGRVRETIGHYERGRVPDSAPVVPDGYLLIAKLFGWTPGSIDRILAGGEPELATSRDQPAAQVVAELSDPAFRLVDAARDAGAPADVVLQARMAISELIGWLKQPRREDLDLAASRPHASDEDIPSDDVARILAELGRSK